jgi:hypothetical protein
MSCDERTGCLLATLAATRPGGRLLELGTGVGEGTAWLLSGMPANASPTPDHYGRCSHRSPTQHRSPISTSADINAWAASSMSTDIPLDLNR